MQCIIIYLLLCWWCYRLRPVSDVILVTTKHTIASRPHLACLSQGWNFCSEGTLRFPTTLYWGHKSFSFSGVTSERRINSNLLQVFLFLAFLRTANTEWVWICSKPPSRKWESCYMSQNVSFWAKIQLCVQNSFCSFGAENYELHNFP